MGVGKITLIFAEIMDSPVFVLTPRMTIYAESRLVLGKSSMTS